MVYNKIIPTFAAEIRYGLVSTVRIMEKTEYIIIKNASRKVLQRMRKLGIDKAQRLQDIQKRWDAGDYKDVKVIQL